jgi:hypothetical protein
MPEHRERHSQCPHCGALIRVRSFCLLPNRCQACGSRHDLAGRVSRRSVTDVVATTGIFAASVAAAAGVAYLSVCVLRIATGNPNGWLELGIWIWFLSIPSFLGGFALICPRLLGYQPMARQTHDDPDTSLLAPWIKPLFKSGVFLISFLVWPRPDLASKMGAVLVWIVWLAFIMRSLIRRTATLEWQAAPPEPHRNASRLDSQAS